MQTLLTKGIGHTQFKETEIGEIPLEWNVFKLGDIAKIRYGLGQPPQEDSNGVRMIRATNIKGGEIVDVDIVRIKVSSIPKSRDPVLRLGDILVVRSGAYTGDVAHVSKKYDGSIGGYDLIVRPVDKVNPLFLTSKLQGQRVQSFFLSLRARAAQPHLNAQQVARALIPLPPLGEQGLIASILAEITSRKNQEKSQARFLGRLRIGLSQTLLTGKVRVKLAEL